MDYVVSPFLVEQRLDARGNKPPAGTRLLRDGLTGKCFLLFREEYDLLGELRLSAPTFAEAALAEHRGALDFFVDYGLVLRTSDAFRRHAYKAAQIEINQRCNYRCQYCPNSQQPRRTGLMGESVFDLVLRRIADYGIRFVHLHHYGEPTVHPKFGEYVQKLKGTGFALELFTNASGLNEKRVAILRDLRDSGTSVLLILNVPSADPRVFRERTGTDLHATVMRNIDLLLRSELPVQIRVDEPLDQKQLETDVLRARFPGVKISSWTLTDRAGSLDARRYALPHHHEGRMAGCGVALGQFNVSFEGKIFLCHNDYHQRHVMGDLATQSVKEIAEGEAFTEARRRIFGGMVPEPTWICTRCSDTISLDPGGPPFFPDYRRLPATIEALRAARPQGCFGAPAAISREP